MRAGTTLVFMSIAIASLGQGIAGADRFEVASVKPNFSGAMGVRIEPSRLTLRNLTLFGLICRAYDLQAYQLSGGPKWMNTDRFDIEATSAAPTTEKHILEMLQALLVERFDLAFRREQIEIQGYALVVSKRGPKLKPSLAETPPANSMKFEPKDGHHVTSRHSFQHENASDLAVILTRLMQHPVVDRTNLRGQFDFVLEYESLDPAPEDPGERSIFSIIEDQLGLRLEKQNVQAERLVVERANQPTQN